MNTFHWRHYKKWKSDFEDFLIPLFPNIEADIRKYNQNIHYIDYMGEKLSTIYMENDFELYFTTEFTEFFRKRFSKILTFHAARPVEVDSYYKQGLQLLKAEDTHNKFRQLIASHPLKTITPQDIEDTIKANPADSREGITHIVIDRRIFPSRAGHYLIYGSEYLFVLVQNLKVGNYFYRDKLRNIGIPTIFHIEIPTEIISDFDLKQLYLKMFNLWVYNTAKYSDVNYILDFTFTLKKAIAGKFFTKHIHPNSIKDSHEYNRIYSVKRNDYI